MVSSAKGRSNRPPKKIRSPQKSFFSKYRFEIFLGVIIWAAGFAIWLLVSGALVKEQRPETKAAKPPAEKRVKPEKTETRVVKLAPYEEPLPPQEPHIAPPRPIAKPFTKAKIALIIDDLGADMKAAEALLGIDAPITFAILPHQRHSAEVANRAAGKGRVVMLHLPMEPKSDHLSPGPGALTVSLSEDQIVETINRDMETVPHATGANNHMGSRFTEDAAKMPMALRELKKRGLFFVDSRTTPKSVGYKAAEGMKMPVAGRDVFLDNERDKGKIETQIATLVRLARKHGYAIGIGHPYPETIAALKETLPGISGEGVEVAPVTELLSGGGGE